MTSIDWNAEIDFDPEEEYQSLLRILRWTDGFGLMFVHCSPAEGKHLIDRIHKDILQKKTATLTLGESDWNLYDLVNQLPNKDELNILFVQGLENPIYDYEKNRLWDDSSDRYSYSLSGVPRLLSHLNMRRESFRDNLRICFVFLVPLFVLKYLIRRAPDFFDWRSGVWRFDTDPGIVKCES